MFIIQVIGKQGVLKLKQVVDLYYGHLQSTPFHVEHPHGKTIKNKIVKAYGETISFVDIGKVKGKYDGLIMYSSSNDLGNAIRESYRLASKNHLLASATFLRNLVKENFKESEPLRWPVTANDLEKLPDQIPAELNKFLLVLFTGSESPYCSQRATSVVESLSQDICRAVTCNRWKLPKHIIMSMALHHMFRSRQLNDMVYRLGHAESLCAGA